MKQYFSYHTKIGRVTIAENGTGITNVSFQSRPPFQNAIEEESALIRQAWQELEEYLNGRRTEFSVPIDPQGTPFQLKTWQALCQIPYGQTRTYKEIAEKIGSPKGYRAVGMANHRNPIWILVPCHRVIGSCGRLTVYAGGLEMKERLLALEKKLNYDNKLIIIT